jgi:hypothetical protein
MENEQSDPEEIIHVSDMVGTNSGDTALAELSAMRTAYAALAALEGDARSRAFSWLSEALGVTDLGIRSSVVMQSPAQSEDSGGRLDVVNGEIPAPRDFMTRKKPQSHVERIACLAYYLANYRGVRSFKSPEISELNIEAAGHKFGNLSRDMDNADRSSGFIVSAGKGAKQLTARGEAVVDALPDREAVKLALQDHPYRVKRSAGSRKKAGPSSEEDE